MQKSADAFRTISEVADDLSLPQHVLRFWETRFPQIRPLKRAGGRRYYRPADVSLLRTIRQLLYDDGYTIKGVQRLLKEQGAKGLGTGARTVEGADVMEADLAIPEVPGEDASDIRDGMATEDTPYDAQPSFGSGPYAKTPSLNRRDEVLAPRSGGTHRDLIEHALSTVEECQRILDAVLRPTR